MEAFKDTAGRIWTIDVTAGSVKRVKALAGVDLQTVLEHDADLLGRLSTDMVLLVDVLFALVQPDANAKGITDEEFGRAFSGDVLLAASDALHKAIVSFLPRPEVRAAVTALLAKGKRLGDLLAAELGPILDVIDPDKMAAAIIDRTRQQVSKLNGLSGNTPESRESTPTPSRSAS